MWYKSDIPMADKLWRNTHDVRFQTLRPSARTGQYVCATIRKYDAQKNSGVGEVINHSQTAYPHVAISGLGCIFSLARHGRITDVEKLLVMKTVPINTRDMNGNTIFMIACQNGLRRMAKLALRYGADINCQNYHGNTALHFCYAFGYGNTLGAYLSSKGADVNIRNCVGATCHEGLCKDGKRKRDVFLQAPDTEL
jgi:ankyrin repeat protein